MRTFKTTSFSVGIRRAIALSLCAVMLPVQAPLARAAETPALASLPQAVIPESLGRVDDFFQGSSGRTVFFIQDAHDSLEAQENIAGLIRALVAREGVKKVFEEGYEGPVPSDRYFGRIEDPVLREKVSYYFMDKLRIGGAEYAHINRDADFELIGADSIRLHFQNVEAYREALRVQDKNRQNLDLIAAELRKLSDRFFPKDLKAWMKLKARYSRDQLGLLDYLKRTRALKPRDVSGSEFPLLDRILKEDKTREDVSELEGLDAKRIFLEMEHLETSLSEYFLSGETERRLFQYLQAVQLLQRLNEMTVSSAEYEALREILKDFDTRTLAQFIVRQSGQSLVLLNDWEENIKPAQRFYETAHERDGVIEETLAEQAPEKAVLVYGGFHLAKIKEILKKRGDSFYVISPKMSGRDERHALYYRELMADGFKKLTLPGMINRASVAPRAYEITLLEQSQAPVFLELLDRVERAAEAVSETDRLRALSEIDLTLALEQTPGSAGLTQVRSELRTDEREDETDPEVLFSRLQNSLDGNTLSHEDLAKRGRKGIVRSIYERLDFVQQMISEGDAAAALSSLRRVEDALPKEDSFFDPAREALAKLQAALSKGRSELRGEASASDELTAVERQALRLAHERKVVALPYFANYHQVSFGEAVRALEKAGFVSGGHSEVGEQFVYPLTAELDRELLKENPETGEDEARVAEIEALGIQVEALKKVIAKDDSDPRWVQTTRLSPIASELEPAESPFRKLFIFRENTEHGLNNLAAILLMSPRSVRVSMLRDVADDLWVSAKVLEDITSRPVNDYSVVGPSVKPVIFGRNAANRMGSGAINSAAAGQFTAEHYEQLRSLQKDFERIYGNVLRVLNAREQEFIRLKERQQAVHESLQRVPGVVFADKDNALFEKLTSGDLERLKAVLAGSREEVRRLAQENPGRIYFKAEDGYFKAEGRSVYLRLEAPVEIFSRGKTIVLEQLRVKGLKIEAGGEEALLYKGRGSVETRVVPGKDGSLNVLPSIRSPRGGLRESDAQKEYAVMTAGLDAEGYRTDYPVAWGVFPGLVFQGEGLGFVISGFEGEDVRISTVRGDSDEEVLFTAAPVQNSSGGEMDDGSARVLYRSIGRALRAYHDAGFYHGYPHLGNLGVKYERKTFEIILRDLNTTAVRTPAMTPEEETAYRFMDLGDVLVRLLNLGREDLSETFLRSYFFESDHAAPSFHKMTAAAKDLSFLLQFLRLDGELPASVELDNGRIIDIREEYPPLETLKIGPENPFFGALWQNLSEAVQARSELRTEDLTAFLHKEVFIHQFGSYEILADYRYADLSDIDRQTLQLLSDKPSKVQPGPFRAVLLNAYRAETAVGTKNPFLILLNDDPEHPAALGKATLQDAAVFLDGLAGGPFAPGESLEHSYFVTRTDVFSAYQGQALMQRAVTALLLKGAIRKWIPSATQLHPSRRMYERMKEDERLLLSGRNRVNLVTARSELRDLGTQDELVDQMVENWDAIRERGFFMFDMQKTLAARKKPATEGMIRLLAWMLEEKIRIVINSGNPMKDVTDQIMQPLRDYLGAQGKLALLSDGALSVYSASGTVLVTFDDQGREAEHPDYEARLRIARPVVEKTIHDVLLEFAQKKFGLDEAGIEQLSAAYKKDAAKNPALHYQLPWAEGLPYEPSRVLFTDLESKALNIQGPYIQFRGSQVTDQETTSITITKLPSAVRPAVIKRLKELLKERLGEDFLNHLSLSSGGESSIDIFSADANKAKALIHYSETAVKNSGRPELSLDFGYYFGDELTGSVHGSTLADETHKGNDMIVEDYPFENPDYRRLRLVSLSPEKPEGIHPEDLSRTYWAGVEQKGTEELFGKVRERIEAQRASLEGASDKRSEMRGGFEAGKPGAGLGELSDEELYRRLTRTSFEKFIVSNTAYILLSPRRGIVLKFFNPKTPYLMYSDELWKFWFRGFIKSLLGWQREITRNLGQGYEVMAQYRKEHPELPEHVKTRVLKDRNSLKLLGINPLLRVGLFPHRLWVVQEFIPQNMFLEVRIKKAVDSGKADEALKLLETALDYEQSFWRDGYADSDLGLNILENTIVREPEAAGVSTADFDLQDQGGFTQDPERLQRYFSGIRRTVDAIDVRLKAGLSLRTALEEMNHQVPEYHFRNVLARIYSLLPDSPEAADVLAQRFFNRVRSEFTFEKFQAARQTPPASDASSQRSELRGSSDGQAELREAIEDLVRFEDSDMRKEALGELRKLTLQRKIGLSEESSAAKERQVAQLLSLLADPDSGVRNGTARVMARLENFPAEKLIRYLEQPEIDARYTQKPNYRLASGLRNARLAALYALGQMRLEDHSARRASRWLVFVHSHDASFFENLQESVQSKEEAEDLFENPDEQSLLKLLSAGIFFDGPWTYAAGAVKALAQDLPYTARKKILRSELRRAGPEEGLGEQLEKTALLPARVFVSYEEIRSPDSTVYEDLFALGYEVRSSAQTRIVVYDVPQADLMNERLKQLRDNAGILTVQGDLRAASEIYGREKISADGSHSVHWSMRAERLKNQPEDVLSFLGASEHDLYAALLFARSGGSLPGVSKNKEGYYSVTEDFLHEELARYQASLVIETAA